MGDHPSNSSFVIAGADRIADTHGGFVNDDEANLDYLVEPPPEPEGEEEELYYEKTQTYSCLSNNGTLSEKYTIRRIYKSDGTKVVNKSYVPDP